MITWFRYVPQMRTIDDGDDCAAQALSAAEHCTRFECQTWTLAGKLYRPRLVLKRDNWTCPKCKASYGADAKN